MFLKYLTETDVSFDSNLNFTIRILAWVLANGVACGEYEAWTFKNHIGST